MPVIKYKYRCVFPNCGYGTNDRSLIELHHVNPQELHVTLNHNVTIPLCPTHHKLIYHPGATAGQHAIAHPESMSVVQVCQTNTGTAVIFRDSGGTEVTVCVDDREYESTDVYELSWSICGGLDDHIVSDYDDMVDRNIARIGYYQTGNRVYYINKHRRIAYELLSKYIETFMVRAKAEYESMLEIARSQYRDVRKVART